MHITASLRQELIVRLG